MASSLVAKQSPTLVRPSQPTPTGNLALSSIDKLAGIRIFRDLLLVFDRGVEPGKTIKEALSKALVFYYPFAGRIEKPQELDPEIACTGEGVWFVEAAAECKLEDVNYFEEEVTVIAKEELLARPPKEVECDRLIFMMQVTEFKCGGFAVGVSYNHLVFDGLGVGQFVTAIADMARGLHQPLVDPIWFREAIPSPTNKEGSQGPPPKFTFFQFESSTVDVSIDTINRVKNLYTSETGQRCSTFDAVTAIVWQCRLRAINHEPNANANLTFMANARHLLGDYISSKGGYSGNCIYPVSVSASGGKIMEEPLVEVVNLIRDAKQTLSTKFLNWINGVVKDEHYSVALDYQSLIVTDWTRLGFSEMDYGWGKPRYVLPFNDGFNLVATCVYVKPPAPKQGVRLLMRCVEKKHLAALHDELAKLG